MEALKALKDKLKAEKEALASSKDGTGSKYTTKAELEAFRIKRLRDEEDEDRRRKVRKSRHATRRPLDFNLTINLIALHIYDYRRARGSHMAPHPPPLSPMHPQSKPLTKQTRSIKS